MKTKNKKHTKKYLKAFTLVELIVVIGILAILGTIAFVSFGSYSSNSRDSVRVSDINSLKKSMELYMLKAGSYPEPDNGVNITYSGGVIWTQGKAGDTLFKKISSNLSKKTIDPLTSNEYVYSLTANKREFELKADFENRLSYRIIDGDTGTTGIKQSVISIPFAVEKSIKNNSSNISWFPAFTGIKELSNPYIQQVRASDSGTVCYINGNYNGLLAKTNDGTKEVIIAVPSLILSDTSKEENTTFTGGNIDKLGSGILQCNGSNTPCVVNYSGGIVWSGTLTSTDYPTLLSNIKSAYSGSNITSIPVVQNILALTGTSNITNTIGGLVKSVGVGGSVIPLTPEDGICGSDNGLALNTVPNNLCNKGSINLISFGGPWTWTCLGINGGLESNQCKTNDSRLLTYLNMDELNGTLQKELISGYDFTINGTTQGIGIKGTTSRIFNGTSSDYLYRTNNMNFGTSQISIGFWIKTNQTILTNNVTLFHKYNDGSGYGYLIRMFSNGNIDFFPYYGLNNVYADNVIVNDGQWHNVFFTRNGDVARIYFDGQLKKELTGIPINNGDNAVNAEIGKPYRSGNSYFQGNIDDFKIYNKSLSEQEILDYYNSTK